jgi:ssDNA-binding Zn-finger/Zn-ribbon topoisomerase 1
MMDKCKFCGKKLKTFTIRGVKHTYICSCYEEFIESLELPPNLKDAE